MTNDWQIYEISLLIIC